MKKVRERVKNPGRGCKILMFLPVYARMPLSPRNARHFPPRSGEADIKEEKIHVFIIYKDAFSINLCRILR